MEQHPRRGAARGRRAGPAAYPGADRRAGSAHARRSQVLGVDLQFRQPVAGTTQPRLLPAHRAVELPLRRGAARWLPGGDRAVLRPYPAPRPPGHGTPHRRLHVREQTPGGPLRHHRRSAQRSPARRTAAGPRARRSPGPRQPARHHLPSEPDITRPAWKMGACQPVGYTATTPTAGRAGPGGRQAGHEGADAARATPHPPRARGLRGLPQHDRPAGLRAGKLRRHRPLARTRRLLEPDRQRRRPARRHESGRRCRVEGRPGGETGTLRHHHRRAPADLRPGKGPRALRRTDRAPNRRPRGRGRLPHAIPDRRRGAELSVRHPAL